MDSYISGKKWLLIILVALISVIQINSQTSKKVTEADTTTVQKLIKKSEFYFFNQFNADSSMYYAHRAEELSRKINFTAGLVASMNMKSGVYRAVGNYPKSLETLLEVRELLKDAEPSAHLFVALIQIGATFSDLTDYEQALQFLLEAKDLYEKTPSKQNYSFLLTRLGNTYEKLNKLDSSMWYQQQAWLNITPADAPFLGSIILQRIGITHFRLGNFDSALYYYHKAVNLNDTTHSADVRLYSFKSLADLHNSVGNNDSVFYYGRLAYLSGKKLSDKQVVMEASQLLSKKYREVGRMDSAFYYLAVSTAMKDSLYGLDKLREVQLLALRQLQEKQMAEKKVQLFKSRTRTYILFSAILIVLLIALILFYNNRQKQKANRILQTTLTNLKTTQAHLIQSEKMASLGELTAGIAHEIQNPLNFVNNFSEVNKELADELKTELATGNMQLANEIAGDIKENSEKINHHGKRADAIVKGMLQHSRSSSGTKEPTDINALCDEYLRLAYHGLRAKDKSFNVKFETDFDPSIEKINVVPQDIGRVVLNLINNAFYVVTERKKLQQDGYEPTVIVSTKLIIPPSGGTRGVEIRVKDNGNGIPESIKEKIFQPFFTTKPTGSGTGLGLSLSYDIIKAHGGDLKVETKEGKGSEFIINLPAN